MTQRFYLRGIQAKTFFIFFIVFVIIIVPVNFLIYNKVKGILAVADSGELKFEAERLLSTVRLDPPFIPLPSQGYSLKVQWSNEFTFDELFTSPDFPQLEDFQYFMEESEADTFKVVTLSKPGASGGQLLLSLARSDQRLESQLTDLQFYLFTANAASIFLAGLVVFIVTGITLRPIRKIIRVANRINASKSIERVPIPPSKDENRLLAETINAMLARIEQTIQTQTNFFASAAHELKTPLTVMQTELSIALQTETNPEVIKILQSNLVEAQRLDHVIQDFLLISQLRSESLSLRKQTIELDEVIYSALRKVKYLVREYQSSIKVNISETPLHIIADYDKMETVLTNLLENAIKYSVRETVIDVSVQKSEGHIILSVINSVSQEMKNPERLKEEFSKSEQLSSGLGMGLWICDRIIEMHHFQFVLRQHHFIFVASIYIKLD